MKFKMVIRKLLDKIPKGMERSLYVNRLNGKWRVIYPDGKISQPFFYDVAVDFKDIYGGSVKHESEIQMLA